MNTKHKTGTSILLILMATVFVSNQVSYGQSLLTADDPITENGLTTLSVLIPFSRGLEFYAQSSTIELLGVYRFETQEDFFWGGGHLITETDGKAFASDFAVGLAIRIYDTQDGESLTWQFVRPDGTMRGTYYTWTYDLDTDCWQGNTWPWTDCGDAEHPYLMNIRHTLVMVINSSDIPGIDDYDPPGIWTINFLKNGALLYTEQFELVPVPKLIIKKAAMVSPNELGIGIEVEYPAYPDYEEKPLYVKFSATINGMPVEKIIPVDEFIESIGLGEVWGRGQNQMFDINGNLLPTTPLRIDLRDPDGSPETEATVPKFTDNETFQLAGVAYCDDIESKLKSKESEIEVDILLPVVVLHGYIDPDGYPLAWWKGGSLIAYEVAYKNLSEYLVSGGYTHESTWDDGTDEYRTLWDPSDFIYSDPRDYGATTIENELDRLLTDAWEHNYASKVNFVGHSFGGLVARHYASVRSENVRKVITVGTPHTGATRFFENAFTMSRAAFEEMVQEGDIMQWAIPKYDCTYLKNKSTIEYLNPLSVSPLFKNTLTTAQGSGVAYYSIYGSGYSTPRKIFLVQNGDWYKERGKGETGAGDGYILAESASAFGSSMPPIPRGKNAQHAVLLNNTTVKTNVLALLRQE